MASALSVSGVQSMPHDKKIRIARTFSLEWTLEPLQEKDSFATKKMFGGLAVYVDGRMVMLLAESPGERSWKKQPYDFDLWNGVLFPLEREVHASLIEEFQSLMPHPVLGKWLYLPMEVDNFEETIQALVQLIAENDLRFGVYPKVRKKRKKKTKVLKKA